MRNDDRYSVGAGLLAALLVAICLAWSTRVAAGADAYGYVSQADLWLRGDLFIDQSFAADVPWPMARWTFTPLGYRPEVDGYRIVPAYAPGLSLLMAAAKRVAGQCAVFWVVPLAAGILVLATFSIGRSIGQPPFVALGAAWLVATSPTVLFMSMAPMSDVPAAAGWAVAVGLILKDGVMPASAAGLAAGIAILIRPNLAPLAAILLAWLLLRRRFMPAAAFFTVTALGAIAIALVNTRLYGSPLKSGYDLAGAFSGDYVLPNIGRYGSWLIQAETPLAIAGLCWLAWSRRWFLLGFAAAVWANYLIYVPWDAWWYLRFLLPSWPMMAVGTAMVVSRLPARLVPVAFAALGIWAVGQAWQRGAFAEAAGESKYVEVARVVESLTDERAVVISAQHSGTLRYYAGRWTLRWDVGDLAWLDRTVDWLAANGRHVYLLLEEPEIEALRAKAAGTSVVARVDWNPIVSFRGGAVKLFDAVNRQRSAPAVANKPSFAVDGCVGDKSRTLRWSPRPISRGRPDGREWLAPRAQ